MVSGIKDRMPLDDFFNYRIHIPKFVICEECRIIKPILNCSFYIYCSKWIWENCKLDFINKDKEHFYSKQPIMFIVICDFQIKYDNIFYFIVLFAEKTFIIINSILSKIKYYFLL